MVTSPLVTIAIPNYNYSRYVCEALESVSLQNYLDIEILVLDDKSTDNSVEIVNSWISHYKGSIKVRLLCNSQNGGLTKACNVLLNNATGKYIQFLDADDRILPGKIARQVQLLEENSNAALVYSDTELMNEDGVVFGQGYLKRIDYDPNCMPTGNVHAALFSFNFVPLPSVLVRRQLLLEEGGFDESLGVQDYYMWLKLSAKHEFIFDSMMSARYRVHSSSMSNSHLTNPNSVHSVLEIKYRYFKTDNHRIREVIKQTLGSSAPYLYRYGHPAAKKWVKRNLIHNPSLKNFIQYICIYFNMPYFRIVRLFKRLSK
jgi:glycosyltransferase involved in cell wall biosynthesis